MIFTDTLQRKNNYSGSRSLTTVLFYLICHTCLKQRLLSYKINIYTKTAFYSQPIKDILLIILKN